MRALVTAGGTRESLDEVRHIGNFSRGGFGFQIAKQLVARGIQTTLLGNKELIQSVKPQTGMEMLPFVSFEDLYNSLQALIKSQKPEIIIMAAAVGDYSPKRLKVP